MAKQKLTGLLSGLVGAFILLIGATVPVAAATNSSGNGLKISPVVTNITINPGQSQVVPVYVQNVTNATVTLQVVVNDFTAGNDENGTPNLLLDPNQYAPTHSLKRLVGPVSNVTLQPGQQQTVNVTVAVPQGAAGGGYYGAIRFAPVGTNGNANVSLQASVASLVLVRVPGNIVDNLKLVSLDTRSSGTNDSTQVLFTNNNTVYGVARFQDLGNVQEQPFGKILLEQNGKQLASYEINNETPRGNVLPGSIRRFAIHVDHLGLIGKYTLVGNFGYGTDGQLLSGQTTFYVVPLGLIVAVVVLLALIGLGIYAGPRLVRRYNQRVIQQSRR